MPDGLYITRADVETRLAGKVRFTDSLTDENRFPRVLLDEMINEAEGQVEQDLSPRYAAPLQTKAGTAYTNLPERPTKNIIKTLCTLMACIRVLESDFGRGSVTDAEKYSASIQKRYDAVVNDKILAKRKDTEPSMQWAFPPLPDLMLNYFNTEADDGFFGFVGVAGQGDGGYPAKQINDPSENFWMGELD